MLGGAHALRCFPRKRSVSLLADTTVDGCGVAGDKFNVLRSTITGASADGLQVGRGRIYSSTVTGSAGRGIAGEAVDILDSTITSNGGAGVYLSSSDDTRRSQAKVRRSTIGGNADGILSDGIDLWPGARGRDITVMDSAVSGNVASA
jgi:hypothetical protein